MNVENGYPQVRNSGIQGSVAEYRARACDALIRDLLAELPALLIVGPRACGKTTTASRHAATIVRLDRAAEAVAFRADPDSALRGFDEPVLLDEWQAAPEVLGAVKRAVDQDPRPGRFILTGSVRADLDAPTWPGTGRLVRVPLFGMTVAELRGRPQTVPLVDRLARGDELAVPSEPPDLRGYVDLALRSGFPEAALSLSGRTRARWVESYLDQLLTRDAMNVAGPRDPAKLRRFFEAYALNTAGLVEDNTLLEAAGLNRKTAVAYEQLLVNLMIVDRVPAWTTNRLKRLIRSPKRYVVDAALVAGALRLDDNAILRDGDLLGRLLDTFVAAQLRGQSSVAQSRPTLHHLRQEQGRHEIDLIAEISATRVIAIEVKASSAPRADAAKHLVWLREHLGERFVRGVVLHTGPRSYELDDRIVAAPIASLWA
jgi:predicted AAA+ superfamily ATPase